jgi:hypothetical protein
MGSTYTVIPPAILGKPAPPSYGTLAETNSPPREVQLTLAALDSPLRFGYGRVRIGAHIAFPVTYGADLLILCVHGRGPIEAVEAVEFDNKPAPAGVQRVDYLGTPTQVADPWLVAAWAAKGITYTDTLPNIAYSVLRIPPGVEFGVENIAFIVKWARCYDPRIIFYQVRKNLTTSWSDVGSIAVMLNAGLARDGTNGAHRISDIDGNPSSLSGRSYSWTVANDDLLRSVSISINKDVFVTHQAGIGLAYSGGGTPLSYVVKINLATGVVAVHSGAGGSFLVVDRVTHWEVIVRLKNNLTGNTTLTMTLYAAIF